MVASSTTTQIRTSRKVPKSPPVASRTTSRHLQADEQEDRVLEDERDGAPVGLLGQPRRRGLQRRRLVPEQQADDHDREHAARVHGLGGEVGEERRDQRQRRVEHRVLDPLADRGQHGGHGEPDDDPAAGGQRGSRRPTSSTVTVAAMAAIVVRSATRAVASLSRLSPSRIVTIRRGMPTRRAIGRGGDRVRRRRRPRRGRGRRRASTPGMHGPGDQPDDQRS